MRLLFNMYKNQTLRVRFNNTYSDFFSVTNGVKQGGVISPTLFTCYVDGMLQKLRDSQIGCNVGNMYMGCMSYADDLVLLAPTISSLNHMIKICETYAVEHNIQFNGTKSKLAVFSNDRDQFMPTIYVSGEQVEIVNSLKYLGHTLHTDILNPHVEYVRRDFLLKVNSFLGDFPDIASFVKYDLFNKYCMCLYGSNISNLASPEMAEGYTPCDESPAKNAFQSFVPYYTESTA